MALRRSKCFSEMDVLKVMSNDSHDVETNKVYCQTKIGESIARLSDAERLIDDTQNDWDQVLPRWPPGGAIRSNGGDKGAATSATQDMIPGGKTQLFNTLSQDKCLVNVRIVGPPLILADMDEKKSC